MNNLQGQAGEVRCTVTVKRAETGKEEIYELVGKVTADEAEQLGLKEKQDGCNA
jgi:transcription elongation GreA/GreB family factor